MEPFRKMTEYFRERKKSPGNVKGFSFGSLPTAESWTRTAEKGESKALKPQGVPRLGAEANGLKKAVAKDIYIIIIARY